MQNKYCIILCNLNAYIYKEIREMTNYAKQLTKEYLMSLGITEVTEDGKHIYKGDKEVTQYKHSDGYLRVQLYDKELYKAKKTPLKLIGVHRIVYTWFHGVTNEGMVIDHIDNDKLNNNLSNLRELTPTDNTWRSRTCYETERPCNMHKPLSFYENKLTKLLNDYEAAKNNHEADKVHSLRSHIAQVRNQIRYWNNHSDKYYRFLEIENIKNEIKSTKAVINHYKELLEQCKKEWHEAEGIHKINAKYNIKLCELDIANTYKVLEELKQQLNSL